MISEPQLTIFAGCNGSGKSSFSNVLIPERVPVFDFDFEKKKQLDAITFDFQFGEEIAHQRTTDLFESLVADAIEKKADFAYETNFNYNPLKWAGIFKNAGYKINLVFFMLDSIGKAKERVTIRVENGGHFVSNSEIEDRFHKGYQHLNLHYSYFDQIQLFDTSVDGKSPKQICFIAKNEIYAYNLLPKHFIANAPDFSQWVDLNAF